MGSERKNFKRVMGDGRQILIVGAEGKTASGLGDTFADRFDAAYATAVATVTFKRFAPKVQEWMERDLPGTFAEKQNVFQVIGALFQAECAKLQLPHAKKQLIEKIENDMDEALGKCDPLTEEQGVFVTNILRGALYACKRPQVISPQ